MVHPLSGKVGAMSLGSFFLVVKALGLLIW
jgi:hypothetical protein